MNGAKYENLTGLRTWLDFWFIDVGGVFLIDVLATFLITYRFLTALVLGRIPIYGWLFQIFGMRLLIYVLIERTVLGSLYSILQSTLDAFAGFILLIFIQDSLQVIIFKNFIFLFILIVSAISSWVSIAFLFSRIRNVKKINYQRKSISKSLQDDGL